MDSLDLFARDKLARLDAQSLRRALVPTERLAGAQAVRRGRRLTSFSCNDYLGLAQDPRVKRAAAEALERYGAGAAASRLVTGDHPPLHALECELARVKGKPSALVFGSGYLANVGIPPALVGAGDLVLLDELSHACMGAGARLSGARVLRFRHNDADHLRGLLREERGGAERALILTERVFSMDGDLAPLADIAALAGDYDAWLLVDDAHGLGVVEAAVSAPLEMGTLSKSLGSYGGYLCASEPVIELLKSRARSFVYTTGLPPASAAAALAALQIMRAEPERRARPLELARRFTRAMKLPLAQSAIVPLIVGAAEEAMRLSAELEARGFLVVAIRPPTVPQGAARLRFAFSAAHTDAQVERLIEAMRETLAEPPLDAAAVL
ncbi:MAG TPA: 8-amino-7-oxononanoate synthase [Beijerinckiaceae bacterium]|nr:8-amino-7-oxononanoate synthase [Beijerinckiaceae bacterium]